MRRRTDRDVAAFEARAPRYEVGRLGALHRDIADRTADLALAVRPTPSRVLDVGCGSGYLLRMCGPRAGGEDAGRRRSCRKNDPRRTGDDE
jgi:ubiquinone/menaquinone biosynthesis C-methylase UbiE